VPLLPSTGTLADVRGTLDIDIYRQASREVAEADLRRAATADVGDWFRSRSVRARPSVTQASGSP
jgi:hypothetical protein